MLVDVNWAYWRKRVSHIFRLGLFLDVGHDRFFCTTRRRRGPSTTKKRLKAIRTDIRKVIYPHTLLGGGGIGKPNNIDGGEGEGDLRRISSDSAGAFSGAAGRDGSFGWVFGTKSGRGDSLSTKAPIMDVRKKRKDAEETHLGSKTLH
jgi:hypothetical protein